MSNIPELQGIPDISFIGDVTLKGVREQAYADYTQKYQEITGKGLELMPADPIKLILDSISLLHYQALQCVDNASRSNFLKYATGAALDNLAAFKGLTRKPAGYASVQLRFSITSIRSSATAVPAGTRVSNLAGTYFITTEYAEIPAGSLYVDVNAEAMAPGTVHNQVAVGALTTFVDPHPYIDAVVNLTESSGGVDVEDDDNLTERVYYAPGRYSTAGSRESYEYWAKAFRVDVAQARAYSPAASRVNVVFMLENGELPSAADIAAMSDYLSASTVRPMTDMLTVAAPTEVEYSIALTYYISTSKSVHAVSIQTAVNKAIEEYVIWQHTIGRDINPSELIHRIMAAGAKRVELTAPTYISVAEYNVAVLASPPIVTYGGLEID